MYSRVRVKQHPTKGKMLVAESGFFRGDYILLFTGPIVPLEQASAMSLQLNATMAIESDNEFDNYLNHSCDPNARVIIERRTARLFAVRDIAAGEEITFNYNTTEYDMEAQGCAFDCQCGAKHCIGRVRGNKYLA